MVFQIAGVLIAVTGYFVSPAGLLIGGLLCLAADALGFIRRTLRPFMPAALYTSGFLIAGSWKGILLGSIAGNAFEVTAMVAMLLVRRVPSNATVGREATKAETRDSSVVASHRARGQAITMPGFTPGRSQ
jgi:hypothetical protein